jgi:hypothetical protein
MNFNRAYFSGFSRFFPANFSQPAECSGKTPEEESKELERILAMEGGGMPSDPEEMAELLNRARGKVNTKPPQFQQCNFPLKLYTMVQPNEGFQMSFGMPLSQRL